MSSQLITIQGLTIILLSIAISNQYSFKDNKTLLEPFSSTEQISNHTCEGTRIARFRRSYSSTPEPLHCPPCGQIHCYKQKKRRLRCKGGFTLGICGCCRVCAKLEGEQCGGQHNYMGKCDEGLYCESQEPSVVSFTRNGIKHVYKVEKGICKTAPSRISPAPEVCKPKCDPEYCLKNPRGICSANENAEKTLNCQGMCQHTSCRACKFIDVQQCPSCAKNDFKCIKDFGRCIRKKSCKNKSYPCGNHYTKKIAKGSFQCQVPECLLS